MRTLLTPLLVLSLLCPQLALSENSTKANGYTIHHNALPVTTLSPDIATQYNLVRSKYRGLLNVSVIKDVPETTGEAVSAQIEAYSINLIGKRQAINLREIKEKEAIYYIGEFPIVDRETLKFYMDVRPEGEDKSIKANLSQQFFID